MSWALIIFCVSAWRCCICADNRASINWYSSFFSLLQTKHWGCKTQTSSFIYRCDRPHQWCNQSAPPATPSVIQGLCFHFWPPDEYLYTLTATLLGTLVLVLETFLSAPCWQDDIITQHPWWESPVRSQSCRWTETCDCGVNCFSVILQ